MNLLKPGTLVMCRSDLSVMIVWKSPKCDIDDSVDQVTPKDVMLILKSRKATKREIEDKKNPLTKEWEIGSYKVLTHNGKKGWLGAGWVIPVTT